VRRPDPSRIRVRGDDPALTGVAGLVPFGAFVQQLGVDRELRERFGGLKRGKLVVYPMEAQLRLLLDATVAGEARVFGVESLAADPLFVRLTGGMVPSLDTLYRDLARFDEEALSQLEAMMVRHGLAVLRGRRLDLVHIDIDTTVEPLFGEQQGARPGPNPRYHGRPSYHPLLARVAEAEDVVVGAQLRPGDTGFGADVVPFVEACIDRVREAVGPETAIYVRIDAAGDCLALMQAIAARGAFFLIKARMTPDLCGAIAVAQGWTSVDWDADLRPTRQVADVPFGRKEWPHHGIRVVAVREKDRTHGKQIFLWEDLEYTAHAYLTNELAEAPDDVAHRYHLRAGIEPLIGDLKSGFGIGKVPSQLFHANHAALLLKLLAHNLLRRFVLVRRPDLASWRAPWLRRALVLVPGRMTRSGRRWTLHVPPRSALTRMRN
jgi:hypothetical protein